MIGTHDGHLYEFDPETKFSIRNIVQAHSSTVNGNEIHAAHRSNDKKHIAIADAFGQIKVYRYPCLDKRAKFASGFGIASHASNIRWSKDDRYIIVTGGRDRTVLVWRVDELIAKSSGSSDSESSKTSEK